MGKVYRISEFAERIGRSASTVRRWGSEGRLTARRTSTGQRYFDESDVLAVLTPGFLRGDRKVVVYCWVSWAGQCEDLASQLAAMETFCLARGLAVDEWVSEIGGGMDLLRPKLLDIMSRVKAGQVADLLAIVRTFLCRLHGLRRYEKSMKADDLTGGGP